jgi:hypothetical protein
VSKVPKGNPGGNPDILMATAEAKRKEALERTEQAIAELTKTGAEINFRTVAEKAGVSVPYLYKYEEIKERIQYLREQQKQKQRKQSKKPQSFQPASDKSKAVLIYNLKEDNKRLRNEIEQQRKHIEVVQGKLYELSRVTEENSRLKQQLEKVTVELEYARQQLNNSFSTGHTVSQKVTSIEEKRKRINQDNNDDLKSRLSRLDIKLNPTLKKIIESKSQDGINNAMDAVEEYLATGAEVKSRAGLFRKALEENWMPNLSQEERQVNKTKDFFSEWFQLAKEQGLVQASQGTKDGIIVLEPTGNWTPLTTMLEKGWTLEYLQQRSRR